MRKGGIAYYCALMITLKRTVAPHKLAKSREFNMKKTPTKQTIGAVLEFIILAVACADRGRAQLFYL